MVLRVRVGVWVGVRLQARARVGVTGRGRASGAPFEVRGGKVGGGGVGGWERWEVGGCEGASWEARSGR